MSKVVGGGGGEEGGLFGLAEFFGGKCDGRTIIAKRRFVGGPGREGGGGDRAEEVGEGLGDTWGRLVRVVCGGAFFEEKRKSIVSYSYG